MQWIPEMVQKALLICYQSTQQFVRFTPSQDEDSAHVMRLDAFKSKGASNVHVVDADAQSVGHEKCDQEPQIKKCKLDRDPDPNVRCPYGIKCRDKKRCGWWHDDLLTKTFCS